MNDSHESDHKASLRNNGLSAENGGDYVEGGESLPQNGGSAYRQTSDANAWEKGGRIGKIKKWFKQGKDENTILDWRDDRDTIARIIPREIMAEQLFFRTKVTVHPGEALLIMEKGKIAAPAITAGQVVSRGLIDRIKKTLGFGKDITMMAVDTGNLTLRFSAGLKKHQLIWDDPEFARKMQKTRYEYERAKKSERFQAIEEDTAELLDVGSDVVHSVPDQKAKQELNERFRKLYGYDFADARSKTPLLSKDRESIVLDVKLLITIRTADIAEIYKLVGKETDGKLTIKALESLVDQELSVRVFAPRICKHTADELRSKPEIIVEMQRNAQEELGKWLSGYGIHLMRLSLNPAITDYERAAVLEKEITALDELAKAQQSHLQNEAQRKYERLLLRLNHIQVLRKAKKEGDAELKAIAKASQLTDKEGEMSIEQIDAEIKKLRLDVTAKEKEVAFLAAKRHKELDWDIHRKKRILEEQLRSRALKDKTDADIRVWEVKSDIYQKHKQARLAEMEKRKQIEGQNQKHVESIIHTAKEAGVLTEKALTESIRQTTVRKALDQTSPVAQSFADAEGRRHSKEAFKEGLHQQPSIGFAGNGVKLIVTKPINPERILSFQEADSKTIHCPRCKQIIPVGAKKCRYCEFPIGKTIEE